MPPIAPTDPTAPTDPIAPTDPTAPTGQDRSHESGEVGGPEGSGRRGSGSRSFWGHAALLAVVLFALLPLLSAGPAVTADEGAALGQAQVVQDGEWGTTYWAADVDPDGRWFPFDLSEKVGDRWYLFTKKIPYAAAVAGTYGIGGLNAVLALHVAGVVAAAITAGLIARRLRPGTEILSLWAVGVASPLFFDAYWVLGHGLAAAAAGMAVLGALRARRGPVGTGLLLLVGSLLALAGLRTEGTILALALGLALGVAWVRERRRCDLLAAVAAGVTAVVGYVSSTALERWAQGGSDAPPFAIHDNNAGWLEGRLRGLWSTLLAPQVTGTPLGATLVLASAAAGAVAWGYLRRRPSETTVIAVAAVGSAALMAVTLLLPAAPVAGILPAFPLLVAGAFSLRRSHLVGPVGRLLVETSALYALGVLATQYANGGTGDWGGRYLHLAVPLLTPLLVVAVADAVRGTPGRVPGEAVRETPGRDLRRVLVGSLAATSILVSCLGVRTVVRLRGNTERIVETAHEVAATTHEASSPGGPVVMSTVVAFGRFSWRHAVHGRYIMAKELLASDREVEDAAAALHRKGIEDFVFISDDSGVTSAVERMSPWYGEVRRVQVPDSRWSVAVLERR